MSFNAAGITKRSRDFGPTPPGYDCPISAQYIYKSKKGKINLIKLISGFFDRTQNIHRNEPWEILTDGGQTEHYATQAKAETRIMELLA